MADDPKLCYHGICGRLAVCVCCAVVCGVRSYYRRGVEHEVSNFVSCASHAAQKLSVQQLCQRPAVEVTSRSKSQL